MGPQNDQTIGLELVQCLSNRGAARPQAACDPLFAEPLAGAKLSLDDLAAQPLVDVFLG
jgi:hypothetical protein